MLSKHFTKLIPDGQANNVSFPLCGKAVAMSWLASQGYNIVGVYGRKHWRSFFTDRGMEYSVEDINHNGHNFKLFQSKDGKIRLLCTDIFNFTPDIEGTFDAVWDRGALVDRGDSRWEKYSRDVNVDIRIKNTKKELWSCLIHECHQVV
ncbi:thiopurine S-methyltransferase-like [Physella acuta]|uniref:thiopurine S-methyltransferase-like n=1 Tax=Physella acuta TaxID=109671 RepID=UPI0027DBFD86|nr:thiopurine S-methyltransferase-like [Physella acuta]XP_059146483.1 thiopurine S-methyltransferase-like [Physella acuta]